MLDLILNKSESEESKAANRGPEEGKLGDIVNRVDRNTRPLRWAAEPMADLFDQKKEEMMSCNNDEELLQWSWLTSPLSL